MKQPVDFFVCLNERPTFQRFDPEVFIGAERIVAESFASLRASLIQIAVQPQTESPAERIHKRKIKSGSVGFNQTGAHGHRLESRLIHRDGMLLHGTSPGATALPVAMAVRILAGSLP